VLDCILGVDKPCFIVYTSNIIEKKGQIMEKNWNEIVGSAVMALALLGFPITLWLVM
jgi:hypothetical protein